MSLHTGSTLPLGNEEERERLLQGCKALLTEVLAGHVPSEQILARLLPMVRPDLYEEVSIPAYPRYDRQELPTGAQREVLDSLAGLIPTWMPIIVRSSDPVQEREGVACLLVDTVLDGIHPDALDTPVLHARATSRAVALVHAYLLRSPRVGDPSQAAKEVLYLVVSAAAPHLLMK